MQKAAIGSIIPNPTNPRIIKDDKFKKLVKSIEEFPEMLELRPIVVDSNMVVLGGNMRLKACVAAGLKEIPIIVADQLTDAQKGEFIIKDNVGFGEWDWDLLANEWETAYLSEWGVDIPFYSEEKDDENQYTQKIDAPNYEPTGEKPEIVELYNIEKYNDLVREIDFSSVPNDIKTFLKVAAARHIVFNYENIAEFYAQSDAATQDLMEKSALVIIDFNKAIEYGFTRLNEEVQEQYAKDYE
jgi:hypothetical protein